MTKNMFLYELEDEMLVVDCGVGFPQEEMLGVDLIIPDISYLNNAIAAGKKVVGFLLTHGHDDHIAALSYILPQMPPREFPIYASPLTKKFVETQLAEQEVVCEIKKIDFNQTLALGKFTVKPVRMTHSVPEALNYIIDTPYGRIYHGSDYKFDWTPVDGVLPEVGKIAAAGNQGVLLLLSDCLNSEEKGFAESEKMLEESFENELNRTSGKFIFTTQSSNILRIKLLIQTAIRYNRKIAIVGRSIEENMADAEELGYLKELPTGIYLKEEKVNKFPAKNVCLIVAGSQGQTSSALSRMAAGEHQVKILEGDTVFISGDPIPGNEKSVAFLIDSLSKIGARVLHSRINDNLHVSGHARQEELKLMIGLTRPKYLWPIGGTYAQMNQYAKLAEEMGYDKTRVFLPEEKDAVELDGKQAWLAKNKFESRNILVDGLGVGDVGNVVLRDRQTLATDGILVAVVVLAGQEINKSQIEIITRGFIYAKGNRDILEMLKDEVVVVGEELGPLVKENNLLQKKVIQALEKAIYRETKRRPLVVVEVIKT